MSNSKQSLQYFNEGMTAVTEIVEIGLPAYVDRLDIAQAFESTDRIIRCMDERTRRGVLHLAGAGRLLGIKETLEFIKVSGATGISWHLGCGAVEIFLQHLTDHPTAAQVDLEARKIAQAIAHRAELPCYLEPTDPDLKSHVSTAIYVDATGEFDQTMVKGLPVGFHISWKWLSQIGAQEYALDEIGIAHSIAFGHHGYGDLFTPDKPFLIVVVAESIRQLERILDQLEEKFEEELREGRTVLDGFVRPS